MRPNQSVHARACRVLAKLSHVKTSDRVRLVALMQTIGIQRPKDQARLGACAEGDVVKARGDAAFFLDDLRG